ncbi:MAG: hypothetical protein A2Y12_16310 [Planctomycetes bacterium GWF2_42_9]|nr:MAG: hypothetical protein A2Y12_16310 [Planctomycetes bacterium GWF2_42_9]
MAKPSLSELMREEGMLDTANKKPEAAPAAAETKAPVAGRGRPKTKPESKLVSFHLPLELIARVDTEAIVKAGGNKSLLLVRILEEYFAKKG